MSYPAKYTDDAERIACNAFAFAKGRSKADRHAARLRFVESRARDLREAGMFAEGWEARYRADFDAKLASLSVKA